MEDGAYILTGGDGDYEFRVVENEEIITSIESDCWRTVIGYGCKYADDHGTLFVAESMQRMRYDGDVAVVYDGRDQSFSVKLVHNGGCYDVAASKDFMEAIQFMYDEVFKYAPHMDFRMSAS